MRTLTTQFRLLRLLRLEAELAEQLAGAGERFDRRPRRAAAQRLLAAVRDVRGAWAAELGPQPGDLGPLRRHVSRSLVALEAAAAAIEQPGADLHALTAEFADRALPLLFFLRGLDGATEETLRAVTAPPALQRTA